MDSKSIRKEMARLIEEIGRHEAITNTEGPLAQAPLQQLAAKISQLNEKAIVLNYLQAAVEKGEINAAYPVKEVKEPELIRRGQEVKREEAIPAIKPEERFEVTGGKNEEQVKMPGDEKIAALPLVVKPEEKKEEIKPAVREEARSQPQGEIDLFGEVPAVKKPEVKEAPKEKQKPGEDKSLARKLQKKPIADLKAAIGINEKFLFINELFGGNMTEYNIALNQINICTSAQEAEAYLNTLRELYKWDAESETAVTFSELVERRFL